MRSQYLRLGVVALLLGVTILSFNLTNEYFALNHDTSLYDTSLWELPSFRSIMYRTGQDEDFNAKYASALEWPVFLKQQFGGIGRMLAPYSLLRYNFGLENYLGSLSRWVLGGAGIVASVACLVGLAPVRYKILWATLLLSGFCWALPMRHSVTFHNFEIVFYIGVSLVFFSLSLMYLRRLFGRRLIPFVAVVAMGAFVLSTFQMAQVGHSSEDAEFHTEVIADFEVIREMTEGKSVFVPVSFWDNEMYQFAGAPHAVNYYLSGSILLYSQKRHPTDFFISKEREEGPALLTPDNRQMFLYDWALYNGQIDRIIE